MKRTIIIISAVLLVCFIGYSFFVTYVAYSFAEGSYPIDEEDMAYYNSIKELIASSETGNIDLKDVFRFDWDRVYIAPKTDLTDDKQLQENLAPKEHYFGKYDKRDGIKCVIFVKGDKVAYEYTYAIDRIKFRPEGQFITRENAVFEVVQKSHWYQKKMILKLKE